MQIEMTIKGLMVDPVTNLPIVILIYIAGNLTRFLSPGLTDGQTEGQATLFGRALSAVLTTILPFLRVFDAKEYTVFSPIAVAGTPFAADPKAITVLALWGFVAVAAMYAVAYVTFALSAGMLLFQNRELGGAEG